MKANKPPNNVPKNKAGIAFIFFIIIKISIIGTIKSHGFILNFSEIIVNASLICADDIFVSKYNPIIRNNIKVIINEGIVVQSTNNMASIGWRRTGARKWNMYTKHSIIHPQGDFEVILFQVGYKPLVTKFNE